MPNAVPQAEKSKANSPFKLRFLFLIVLFWFGHYVFIPFFTPFLSGLGIASTTVGTIVGTYGFSQLLLRIPFGILADKIKSHRFFMALGFGSLMIAGISLYFAHSPALFVAARFLSGVSASTWVSFTVFFSGMAAPEDADKAVSVVMTANNMGTLTAYLFGMAFARSLGIHALFLVSVGAGILGLLLLFLFRRDMTENFSEQQMTFSDVALVLQDKRLLLHSLLAAAVQFVTFATMQSFTGNYATTLGATDGQLAFLSILQSGIGILGSYWVGTSLSAKISRRFQLAAGFGLLGIYCLLVPQTTSVVALFFVQIVGAFGRAVLMTLTMAMSSETIPQHLKSTSMGVYQSVYGLGMTVGPMVSGGLIDRFQSYSIAFAGIAVVSFVAMVWSGFAARPVKE